MGRVFIEYIDQAVDGSGKGKPADLEKLGAKRGCLDEKRREGELIFICKQCQIHLADHTDFISKVSGTDSQAISNLYIIRRISVAKLALHSSSAKCKLGISTPSPPTLTNFD